MESREIISLSEQVIDCYQNDKTSEARDFLIQIYRAIKSNPEHLKSIMDYEPIGKVFMFMLEAKLSNDIDTLQMMASVGYLCTSLALEKDKQNPNLFKDRLLLLIVGHTPLQYTVMSALNLIPEGFAAYGSRNYVMEARNAIYAMEIADIELNPILHQKVDFFKKRRNELDVMIARNFFYEEKTKENVIKTGVNNHIKLLKYLKDRILLNNNVDF